MATVVRKFGTDLSNIQRQSFDAKKKSLPTNDLVRVGSKTLVISEITAQEETSCKESGSKVEVQTDSVSDIQTLVTEAKVALEHSEAINYRYERDFLLSFQQFCKQPIEGLIPEVLPGYRIPELENEFCSTPQPLRPTRSPSMTRGAFSAPRLSNSKQDSSVRISGAVFTPFTSKSAPRVPSDTQAPKISSIIVTEQEKVPEMSEAKMDTVAPRQEPVGFEAIPAINIKLEWRTKQTKKPKPKETDAKRLASRQKQIDIGMNTVGYQKYLELVPLNLRKKVAKTPDIHQVCSKRSWDGQVRKWRRELHVYDPPGQSIENDLVGEELETEDPVISSESEEEEEIAAGTY